MDSASPSSAPLEPGGDQERTADKAADKRDGLPKEQLAPPDSSKGKQSRFPNSKRVEFAGALGLVIWVCSEMLETHEPSKLFVQWLIIVIFCIPVCFYISKWCGKTRVGYALFYALAILTGAIAYRNTFFPAFSIIPREQYVEMKTPRYFMVVNFNGRLQRSPVNIIMFAQLTNLRDKALAINSYQFEGHTTNNTWEVMPTIDSKMGRMVAFVGTNWGSNGIGVVLGPIKEGETVNADFGDDVFPEILNGKIIVPGGVVSGLFFLEGPTNGFDGNIRCRIQDSTDQVFMEVVSPIQATNSLQTRLQIGGGGVGIPNHENIKDLPVVPWSKTFN